MGLRAKFKITDCLVRHRKEYCPQLLFGPYTFLSLVIVYQTKPVYPFAAVIVTIICLQITILFV